MYEQGNRIRAKVSYEPVQEHTSMHFFYYIHQLGYSQNMLSPMIFLHAIMVLLYFTVHYPCTQLYYTRMANLYTACSPHVHYIRKNAQSICAHTKKREGASLYDHCLQWYHQRCVKLSKRKVESLMQWFCAKCQKE